MSTSAENLHGVFKIPITVLVQSFLVYQKRFTESHWLSQIVTGPSGPDTGLVHRILSIQALYQHCS